MNEQLFQWAALLLLLAMIAVWRYVVANGGTSDIVKWLLLDFSGLRFIHSKIIVSEERGSKHPTFLLWMALLYVASFLIASERYERKLALAQDRLGVIATLLSTEATEFDYEARTALERIPTIQKLQCPHEPVLGIPGSIFRSLFLGDENCDPVTVGAREILEIWKQRLNGTDLSFVDLSRAQLDHSDFSGARLTRANLSWASIKESDLSGADFQGANLMRTEFWNSDLSRANFSAADLFEVRFQMANLSEAKIQRVNLSMANLWQANLSKASLRKSNLSRVFAWEADLSEADLWGANLEMAYLKGANLKGARLERANLTDAFLWNTNLSEANFRGANLSGVRFWGANLTKTEGLTLDQLSMAKSLYRIRGLNPSLEKELREKHSELFELPADLPKGTGNPLQKLSESSSNYLGRDIQGAALVATALPSPTRNPDPGSVPPPSRQEPHQNHSDQEPFAS
jgi:uncharacterized protein YjbI with pentapeptide repeats